MQLSNADSEIMVVFLGTSMYSRELQFIKARFPIDVTELLPK